MPRLNAATRHAVWWFALAAVLAIPVAHGFAAITMSTPSAPDLTALDADRSFLYTRRESRRERLSASINPGEGAGMRVFLVNPSHVSFGTAVITPRWLYVPQALLVLLGVAHRWPDPRQAAVHNVIHEAVELRRRGFRFIALADDNFYPVTLVDLAQAARRSDPSHLRELEAVRAERFALMDGLAKLPDDMVFFTQITMEAAEDSAFLQAMARARIRGALVGVEAVTPAGLKDVHKGFNLVPHLEVPPG